MAVISAEESRMFESFEISSRAVYGRVRGSTAYIG